MDATATPRGISLAVGELGARGRPTFYMTSRTAVSVNWIRSLRPSTVFVDVCPRDTHTPHGLSCFRIGVVKRKHVLQTRRDCRENALARGIRIEDWKAQAVSLQVRQQRAKEAVIVRSPSGAGGSALGVSAWVCMHAARLVMLLAKLDANEDGHLRRHAGRGTRL